MKTAAASQRVPSRDAVVLFDGVCNLCTGAVQFIIKRDPEAYFRFCSLQSEVGRQLMLQYHINPDAMDTFVLLLDARCFTKSDAALRIAGKLSGVWPLLSIFWVVPRPLRNWCYDFVARHRYKWFGKKDRCMLPTPDLMSRFVDHIKPA
jgi:predicted DCC family thiol-disulfide oxidoreductase YuxK